MSTRLRYNPIRVGTEDQLTNRECDDAGRLRPRLHGTRHLQDLQQNNYNQRCYHI
jgi:hypothetical protein